MCVCLGLLPADGRNQRGIVKQLFSKKKGSGVRTTRVHLPHAV